MSRVFIYCDNSNIFHEAQRFAEERNEGPDARYRVRINFDNMYRLARSDREVGRAVRPHWTCRYGRHPDGPTRCYL